MARTLPFLLTALLFLLPAHGQDTEWETIETFRGQGKMNTQPFEAPEQWRITWTARAQTSNGVGHLFQLFLKRPTAEKGDEKMVASSANQKRAGSTTYQYEGGRYYFRVRSLNGSWTIKVQVPE